ncbi:chemotaxis protein CheA [Humisphaera borealis]|uniref:histidine kinase n=1 Tax=Humisphaera borealis TaxID=2807512 RepID=A0A7M2WTH7_9BACT|nr:chemotaxis protein CheA [Humisphaera borealis]QOV88121.1 chemotaxis protein CheA [Humisphaera borealis]
MHATDDIVKEFLIESYENLDRLDRELLQLEQPGEKRDTLSSIFRTIHTIKGTCGFLGFGKLEAVSHVGESLLSRLRDGELTVTPQIVSGLLAMVDAIRKLLANIETTNAEGDDAFPQVIATLTRLKESEAVTTPTAAAAPAEMAAPVARSTAVHTTVEAAPETTVASEVPASAPVAAIVEQPAEPVSHDDHGDQSAAAASSPAAAGLSDSTIRVDVSLLDKLMNLVGELVLARNQVIQFTARVENSNLAATSQRLNLITTELQEGVMKTRMQPIGNIWSKFPRVVRDLATMCGKKIRVEMDGKETELDKTIIEAIKDPLTHVVRNSADHGIETPEARIKAGKPAEGRLYLRAFHEGGQVNIEIADDGAGIHLDKVKAKALKQGLITAEQATRMSDREAIGLIFLPGFSTAEKVTNVSGRGVGMDVVKTNIERIGGTLDIQSVQGQGTTLRIKIPLTLAIIPALIITTGKDRYAIPQVSLLELVRLEGDDARTGVEMIHGAPVYRLRGRLLPLVQLNEALGLSTAGIDPATLEALNIVILQAEDRQFGLIVDEINDTEEIVVKPLSKQLKGITAFAGSTIMGDGRVALILDVMGLAQAANVVADHRDVGAAEHHDAAAAKGEVRQTLLLLNVNGDRAGTGFDRRVAIPLSAVARLEEFDRSKIERTGVEDVVQYRGEVMPLVYLSSVLADRRLNTLPLGESQGEKIRVVVYTDQGRSIGLVVDRILDIVEQALTVQKTGGAPGVLGSAVIQDRVTELLDIAGIIRTSQEPIMPRAMAA